MKRTLIALLLALSMALSLAACGAKEEAGTASQPAASVEEQPAASTEEPGVSVELPEVDPDAGQPAASTEGPVEDVMPQVPAEPAAPADPGSEGPSEPAAGADTSSPAPAQPTVQPEPVPEVPAEPAAPAVEGVDLGAFYSSLVQTYGENFPANMNLCESAEMVEAFYPGLSGLSTKQMMIYQPMMGAVVCEIALVEVADSADVETVKGIFQSRIDTQVDGGAWYPESIEGWKNNSRIVTHGNAIMMIAYSECDAVVEAFNALF